MERQGALGKSIIAEQGIKKNSHWHNKPSSKVIIYSHTRRMSLSMGYQLLIGICGKSEERFIGQLVNSNFCHQIMVSANIEFIVNFVVTILI